ncbi:MAG TPA: cellulase family glycosylhydrolase, partial [Anaerolineae bacterium]
MNLRYLFFVIMLLPVLACGNALSRVEAEARPTRVRVIRFNTPTPSVTPTVTLTPTAVPPTTTPTITSQPPTTTPSATVASTPTMPPEPAATIQPVPATSPPESAVTVVEAQPTPATVVVEVYHLGYGVQLAEAKNMDLAVPGGFTWAKHDLNIRKEVNFISNADNLLSDLRKSGTEHVLLKLVVWNEGGLPDAPRTADEVEDFAENAAEAAEFIREKHGPAFRHIAYEIWNEPNLNYEWEGNPNPAEFVALLRAASAAIRQADPQAIIVSGAPSPGGDFDDLKFLDGMYANGAKGLMAAVGSHPYGGPWPYDHPTGIDEAGNGYPFFRKPEAQRAIMEKYGDVDTQIWATEFSWLAGVPDCDFGEHTRWQ